MADTPETKKTTAIIDSLIELLDPFAPGNRVERSIRETLYTSLSKKERLSIFEEMVRQGYNRHESADRLNDLEETYYGTAGVFTALI